ncbi:MAG: UPF0182 family protein [Cyanobacteria bacterium P01_A01_bin.17]
MNNRRVRVYLILLIVLIVSIPCIRLLVGLLTESWWYEAVGYADVFWTRLSWQALMGVVTFALYGLFMWGNYWVAMRGSRDRAFHYLDNTQYSGYTNLITRCLALGLIGVIAWGAAVASVTEWEKILKFLNRSSFGIQDPIFNHDIGFYLFSLPLYETLRAWVMLLLIWSLVVALFVYTLKGSISLDSGWRRALIGAPKRHVSLLVVAIALFTALGFWLERYQLMYSPTGVVFGAGYTDVHARLQAYSILAGISLVLAILVLISVRKNQVVLPAIGIGVFVAALIVFNGIYPWAQQTLVVEPNELEKETPYIANSIKLTQAAYQLSDVQRQNYAAKAELSPQTLQQHQPTLSNIRLWGANSLLSTYRQLQEIRLYYSFKDVDVDRYTLNGESQQVMLSARELDIDELAAKAKTWVNQRLKYTHGYGLAMSPVNQATTDGLPEFYVKNIPPESAVDLPIKQPAIYYGEATDNYIFTGTTTKEFDYPVGNENATTNYSGKGGVPMANVWQRTAYSLKFSSLQLLISNYFQDGSRIHYHRQIRDRIQRVAPFLRFDHDPYLVIINGRLQWLVDAYTTSNRYPYSEPVVFSPGAGDVIRNRNDYELVRNEVNYIRNSVKVQIDAYDGTMQFYAVDQEDPVLKTYRTIFPNLFKTEIPTEVQDHFRYPLDLFKIQAQMYRAYHMETPEVFYNREDLWQFPKQSFEGSDQQMTMEPYYVTMRLPGQSKTEFMLILPFTPTNKDNMIAWMAARSDDVEELLLYEFPKQKLVYGPRQIEARIDQTPSISQQLTLWSQAGSKVIRGDLLVIPIEESLLYVEPIYLRAEQGQLPELKRVIVSYDNAIVMEDTLDKALATLFGKGQAQKPAAQQQAKQPQPEKAPAAEPSDPSKSLAKNALETYRKAKSALQNGNWAEYGRHQRDLENQLQQLNQGQ